MTATGSKFDALVEILNLSRLIKSHTKKVTQIVEKGILSENDKLSLLNESYLLNDYSGKIDTLLMEKTDIF